MFFGLKYCALDFMWRSELAYIPTRSVYRQTFQENGEFLNNIMILSFRTNMSGQTVQAQIRLLLEEQSDQGLHCLLFHLHLSEENP